MARKINARFSHGVFEPRDPTAVDFLRDGDEVVLTAETGPGSAPGDWLHETAGGWRGLVEPDDVGRREAH